MRGHTMWPPGKHHEDLQVNKQEVFRFGDWSIYDATEVGIQSVQPGVTNAHWSSFILHCRTWKEWTPCARPPSNTWIKNETVDNSYKPQVMEVTKRCNAEMTAEFINRCPECNAKIPDEVVALWKLQNFDKIQELHSV